MGILRALLPDGSTVEREIHRHTLYRWGLSVHRDGRWILVSVHRKEATARIKAQRLGRSLESDTPKWARKSVKVVPLIPIVHDSDLEDENHSQSSTRVNGPVAA